MCPHYRRRILLARRSLQDILRRPEVGTHPVTFYIPSFYPISVPWQVPHCNGKHTWRSSLHFVIVIVAVVIAVVVLRLLQRLSLITAIFSPWASGRRQHRTRRLRIQVALEADHMRGEHAPTVLVGFLGKPSSQASRDGGVDQARAGR